MRVEINEQELQHAFSRVKENPVFAESAAVVERGGRPAEMLQALALRPELLEGFAHLSDGVYPGGLIERDIKELVILEASRSNQCQFCRDSHIAMAQMLNIADDPLRLLDEPDAQTHRQQLALEYTRTATADSTRVSDGLFDRLREQFTDPEIVELTFLIGYINALNLFNNCLRVTYHGEYEPGDVETVQP